MKKVFFVAAAALMMCMATSCKEGKCACIGNSENIDQGKIDVKEEGSYSGYTDQMACDELKAQIKAKYPNAGYKCYEGKTVNEVLE